MYFFSTFYGDFFFLFLLIFCLRKTAYIAVLKIVLNEHPDKDPEGKYDRDRFVAAGLLLNLLKDGLVDTYKAALEGTPMKVEPFAVESKSQVRHEGDPDEAPGFRPSSS